MGNRTEKTGKGPKKSPLVKIDPELVEKIQWLVRVRNTNRKEGVPEWTAAIIVEPLIRTTIERDYKLIVGEVERIKRDEAKAAKRLQDHDEQAEAE